MRWTPGGDSSDIEDRRGEGGGSNFGGLNGMHLGIGGTLVLVVLSFLFRTNLFSVLGGGGTAAPAASVRPLSDPDTDPAEKREVEFVTFVLNDVQRTWGQLLPQAGTPYRHTKLVLFRDLTESGCGTAQTATGPFYPRNGSCQPVRGMNCGCLSVLPLRKTQKTWLKMRSHL